MTRSAPLLFSAGLAFLVACGGGQPQTASSPMTPAEQAKKDPSAAASTVSADDISRRPGESVERVLAGKVAGVVVGTNPDGTITVRIRSTTSFLGNEEPLI
ncbi:MAG: TonB-dependent receptor plug domain-containing protein, partial [Gemmatimonadaceae bacterium]